MVASPIATAEALVTPFLATPVRKRSVVFAHVDSQRFFQHKRRTTNGAIVALLVVDIFTVFRANVVPQAVLVLKRGWTHRTCARSHLALAVVDATFAGAGEGPVTAGVLARERCCTFVPVQVIL